MRSPEGRREAPPALTCGGRSERHHSHWSHRVAVLSEPLQLTLLLEISLQGVPHRWMCEGWLRLAAPIQLHSWECFRSLFGFLVHEDGGCHSGGCCGSCRAWPTGSSSTCGGLTPGSAPEVRTASAVLLCLHCTEQREGAGGTVSKRRQGETSPQALECP